MHAPPHISVPLPGELFPSSSDIADMDAFVDKVYLPRIRVRKRSWPIDNRIIRQYLSPVFGKRELATLRRGEVEAWLHALAAGGLAPATCNRILAVFKSICLLAVGYGLLPGGSPCAEVASLEKRVRERCLSLTEARRLMAALQRSPRREALALRLLLLTGARKNEILKARWENVDFDERRLTFPIPGRTAMGAGVPFRFPTRPLMSYGPSRAYRTVPGFFRAVGRAGRWRISTGFGIRYAMNWAWKTCVFRICDVVSPPFWCARGSRHPWCNACSAPAGRVIPRAMPAFQRPDCRRPCNATVSRNSTHIRHHSRI